jgi:hypothetical protein
MLNKRYRDVFFNEVAIYQSQIIGRNSTTKYDNLKSNSSLKLGDKTI